jgi:hypothetical protein
MWGDTSGSPAAAAIWKFWNGTTWQTFSTGTEVAEIITKRGMPARLSDAPGYVTPDVNLCLRTGWYRVNASSSAGNMPGTGFWFLHTMSVDGTNSWVTFDAYEFTTDSTSDSKHYRAQYNNSVWTGWSRVYDTAIELSNLITAIGDARYLKFPSAVTTTVDANDLIAMWDGATSAMNWITPADFKSSLFGGVGTIFDVHNAAGIVVFNSGGQTYELPQIPVAEFPDTISFQLSGRKVAGGGASGVDTRSLNVQYSVDNGATWTSIPGVSLSSTGATFLGIQAFAPSVNVPAGSPSSTTDVLYVKRSVDASGAKSAQIGNGVVTHTHVRFRVASTEAGSAPSIRLDRVVASLSRRYDPLSSTCFPANSMVRMADGTGKLIQHVQAGDMVWTPTGIARVANLEITTLGNRPLYTMEDGSITWSAEHSFWVERNGEQRLWSMRPDLLAAEQKAGAIGGLKDYGWMYVGEENAPEFFATPTGWKLSNPILSHGTPDLTLYVPRTEGGKLISVDGFVVGACVNERAFDYRKLKMHDKPTK